MDPVQTQIDLPNKGYLLPENIPMWPPVWWTWLVVAALILCLIGLVVYVNRRHKARAYRREALAGLSIASLTKTDDVSDKACILLCHEMVRRCLISEGKQQVAALPSQTLFETLDQEMPAKKRFSLLGDDFIHGIYRQQLTLTPEQRDAMLKTTRYWIRKHHA